MHPKTLKKIEPLSDELKPLRPVLSKWIDLVCQYSNIFGVDDACYWHNERANIGVLAAATWQARGAWVSLEEFSTTKHGKDADEKRGRCDLYIAKNGHDNSFALEAKLAWQGARVGDVEFSGAVRSKMKSAWDDAGKLTDTEANTRVAACFVVPRFPEDNVGNPAEFENSLKRWIKSIKNDVAFDGMAWVFPKESRDLTSERNWVFPGVCLLLQAR